MQDHAEQTHQVFVPDLPEMERIQVRGVPVRPQVTGQGWAMPPTRHSRHGSRFSEEGLGSHVTLDVLHSHLLPHVLALQDIWEGTQSVRLSPTPDPLHPRPSPPRCGVGVGHQRVLSGEALGQGTSHPIFSLTSELALPNAVSQCEVLQVQQPASWAWAQGQVSSDRHHRAALSPKPRLQPPVAIPYLWPAPSQLTSSQILVWASPAWCRWLPAPSCSAAEGRTDGGDAAVPPPPQLRVWSQEMAMGHSTGPHHHHPPQGTQCRDSQPLSQPCSPPGKARETP